jgi:AraC-like DNA-binding protein
MMTGYFRLILRHFGTTPARRAAILEGTGITEEALAAPNAHIDLDQQICQIENMNALVGEGWAITAPELWSQPSHGAIGVAALTAPDLAHAIEIMARYSLVRAPLNRLRLRHSPTHLTIKYDLNEALNERQWRAVAEITFMAMRSLVAAILGQQPVEMEFTFACQEPPYAPDLRKVLGKKVVYGAVGNAIRLPKSYLNVPSPFADVVLHDHTVSDFERARRRRFEPAGVRRRVEHLLMIAPVGRLDADSASAALGISRRTLVRRLAESGTRFRDLLDQEMKRRARALLDDGALSHAEIAARLGYADPTSFSRACRRWFGGPKERAQKRV